jgi:phosphoribosyl-ATP pyrophosphohydrolase/phosphoribosyl-AMP cyclohydrolase
MKLAIDKLQFNQAGLIPAIVQDETSGTVLMMAYMNEESLKRTMETKETWFYSRSRQELWHKGGSSGNTQTVSSLLYDCDGDTLLVLVNPAGPACHTGKTSCFYRTLDDSPLPKATMLSILESLVLKRKESPVEGSYTNYLFDKGIDKILKKVGEENAEVIIAAKNPDREEVIYETADLLYHLTVLLAEREISWDEIMQELKKRHKK